MLAHERSDHKPTLVTGEDGKSLSFDHRLTVKAGQKAALLHWLVQQNFEGGEGLEELFEPLYANRRLVAPPVSDEHLELVVNFPANYEDMLGGADYLVAVNQLIDALQLERRSDSDQLRVESGSVLTGDATGGDFTVISRFGELKVPVADVAVLQGGGGIGRGDRVLLRNGSVYAGEISTSGLGLKGGFEVSLEMPQLDYLLYRVGDRDGNFPEGTGVFVGLHSGDVIPITEVERLTLPLVTPWGRIEVPMSDVLWLRYVKEPSPRHRIALRDGSLLTVFLDPGVLKLTAGDLGEQSFSATEIAEMWGAEVELPKDFDGAVDVTEIRAIPKSMAGGACLLSGNNLIAGELANQEVHVLTGATVTTVKLADVVRMGRNDQSDPLAPVYDIELRGGDKLSGMLQERVLELRSGERSWRVPVQHFLAMRSKGAPELEEETEEENENESSVSGRSVVLPPKQGN
ncbi:MAG: hypothetical protein ACI8XO_001789 [Verrucomicrobiales bacterium]